MKKIFGLILSVFLLVGCNQNNDTQYKEEAIKTYVEATNRLNNKDTFALKMAGDIQIPKSAMVEEEVNAVLDSKMIIDAKNFLFKIDLNMKSNGVNENILMYMDKNYIYMYMDGSWIKQSLEDEENFNMDDIDLENQNITIEEAEEFFNGFDEISYVKENIDGVDGYTISGKVDAMALINNYIKKEGSEKEQEEFEQYSKLLESLHLSFSTFVSNDESTLPTYKIGINTEILGTKINVGPFDIKMEKTSEKVVIPKAAKNAKKADLAYEV